MLKIRRPLGRLIFNMGIAIPGKTVFLIETAPCMCVTFKTMLLTHWGLVTTHTLTSWIIVYIWVFILRKFSYLYGLIWVYTLIWNSPFHPIQILFKSTFSVGWKSEQRCEIPAENLVNEIHWRQISPHDYTGNWPSFCWKHTYLSLRWPLHMAILATISSTESCIVSKHMARNIMATRLASMFTDAH